MREKVILIDSNYVGHASRFALPDMRDKKGRGTGVIYGFLSTILILHQTLEANTFAFVWDSPRSFRREIFPGYKEGRRKKRSPEENLAIQEAYKQFDLLQKEILPALGFVNNFSIDGLEGDDLIAEIVRDKDKFFYVYASDQDLYQILSDNVVMIKNKKFYTAKKFKQEFGIEPSSWSKVKALAGCKSDEVPGINGIGEKTVCKYLCKQLKQDSVAHKKIVENRLEIMKRNMPLVRLPFAGTPHLELEIGKAHISQKRLRKIFKEYDFNSFLEDFEEWETLFVFEEEK